MNLFKKIISLMANGAGIRQYQLELGAYLLRKGCGYKIGQVVKEKELNRGLWRVKVITGLFYDFQENKVNHTAENKIIRQKQ